MLSAYGWGPRLLLSVMLRNPGGLFKSLKPNRFPISCLAACANPSWSEEPLPHIGTAALDEVEAVRIGP
jgi:hypothetical protein